MDRGLRVAAHHQNRGMCLGEGAVLSGVEGIRERCIRSGSRKTVYGHGDGFGPGLTKPKRVLPACLFLARAGEGEASVVTMEEWIRSPTVWSFVTRQRLLLRFVRFLVKVVFFGMAE